MRGMRWQRCIMQSRFLINKKTRAAGFFRSPCLSLPYFMPLPRARAALPACCRRKTKTYQTRHILRCVRLHIRSSSSYSVLLSFDDISISKGESDNQDLLEQLTKLFLEFAVYILRCNDLHTSAQTEHPRKELWADSYSYIDRKVAFIHRLYH